MDICCDSMLPSSYFVLGGILDFISLSFLGKGEFQCEFKKMDVTINK